MDYWYTQRTPGFLSHWQWITDTHKEHPVSCHIDSFSIGEIFIDVSTHEIEVHVMMSSNPFRNTALCVWYFRVPKLFVICSIGTLIISEFRPLQLKCCGVSGDVNSTDSWAIYKTKSEWYRTRESGKNTNKNISVVRIRFQPIKGLFSSLKLMMLNMKYNTGMVYWRKKIQYQK